ncbi:hypothetical protein U0035_06450 [Niabella yanshanensis]|uniref:Uncharacterized protein n=1 Tax=Niabella yanshanensis TaxID=577386 RepID=A0ABZ0W9D8_9BACT|nr:hypothetical protein [Niabella yanshanensis]WQD39786.1 hypothetical protein U0035_06450 [Niabella yanshanensis]
MERIRSLIEKLNMQFAHKVPLSQLLSTVQMLQNEIAGSMREVDVLGTSGISVIVPNAKPIPGNSNAGNEREPIKSGNEEKEYYQLVVEGGEDEENLAETATEIPSYEELIKLQEQLKTSHGQARLSFSDSNELADDTPTLSRQNRPGATKAAKQVSAPKAGRNAIKDLNKAITAQDRLAFVRELFRGDEVMFERSIKTINNFSSLTEAEYWIERELKTKNGWMPGHPVTSQFEQLLKRRFS